MVNIMGRKNKWIWGILFVCALNHFWFGVAQAKTNVSDELWKDDLTNIKSSNSSAIDKKKEPSSGKSTIIDVLDLKKMDIFDVLKLISQKSGLNIVAGQNVKGKITVFLKNIEVRDALRIIVESHDWAYVEDGDIIRIMTEKDYTQKFGHQFGKEIETRIKQLTFAKTADIVAVLNQLKSSSGKVITDQNTGTLILTDEPEILDKMEVIIQKLDVLIKTEVFILSYAKAGEVMTKISEMLTPTLGVIESDERSNRIIVSDTPVKIEKIRALIEAFDQKDAEVLIEAKILQVTLSDEYKLGIDWEAVVSDFHSLDLKSNFDILGSTEKRGEVSIGTIAADGYQVLMEALETVGHTEILSSPRIAVINNQEAKILVGSTEPYVTTTTTTPSSGPTTTAESVNFIDVGVKLFVTPTIHQDDFITMKIRPEISSVIRNLTTSNNNEIPVVETSEAETTVIVKDNVTVAIAGLIKEEKIKTIKKIPLLGNIPILGMVFQSKSDASLKTEIVLFLTPKIISGDIDERRSTSLTPY